MDLFVDLDRSDRRSFPPPSGTRSIELPAGDIQPLGLRPAIMRGSKLRPIQKILEDAARLIDEAFAALDAYGSRADGLKAVARYLVERKN